MVSIDKYYENTLTLLEPFNSATFFLPAIILSAICLAFSLAGLNVY